MAGNDLDGLNHDSPRPRSRRRVIVMLIVVGVLGFGCAVPVGGLALWFWRTTADAGKGEACSSCAVRQYLYALKDDAPNEAWRVLGGKHRDDLMHQLDSLNQEVGRSKGGRPFDISWETAAPITDKVTDPDATLHFKLVVTWQTGGTGTTFNTSMIGQPWTFFVVNEGSGGWRIHDIRDATWCQPIRCN